MVWGLGFEVWGSGLDEGLFSPPSSLRGVAIRLGFGCWGIRCKGRVLRKTRTNEIVPALFWPPSSLVWCSRLSY